MKLFLTVTQHLIGIGIVLGTYMCIISKVTSINKEKEICLPSEE